MMMQVRMKRKTRSSRTYNKRRQIYKKKGENNYIVGDWFTNIDLTNCSSSCDSDEENEKVATLAL